MGRHRIHANPFNVPTPQDYPSFGREAPIALEIGYGQGEFLLALAERYPQWNVLGVEIRPHFVEEVQAEASQRGLANLRTLLANVGPNLDPMVPDASVCFASLNFPDPWYKKRHHKRRVVQQAFLDTLAQKLMTGASFHIMTDYQPQAEEISERLEAHPAFRRRHPNPFTEESTTDLHSERERTHMGRGEPVYRMCYAKISQRA